MIETPLPFSILAVLIAGGGCFWTGRRDRLDAVAEAHEEARAARASLTAAEALWSNERVTAARDLAAQVEVVAHMDAVCSHAQGEVERLETHVRALEARWGTAQDVWRVATAYRDKLEDQIAASYVRVGPAFKRWRADGDYTAPCGTQTGVEGCQTGVAEPDTECTVHQVAAAGGPQIEPFRVKMDAEVLADFHEGARLFGVDVRVTPAASFPVHAIGDDGPGVGEGG